MADKEYDKMLRNFFGKVTRFSPFVSSIGITSTYVFSVLAIKEVSKSAFVIYKNLFDNAVLVFGSSLVSSYIIFEYGYLDYKNDLVGKHNARKKSDSDSEDDKSEGD